MVGFRLNIKTCCLHFIWEKQDQIWAKIFCIPKHMHSRTPMCAHNYPLLHERRKGDAGRYWTYCSL